MWNTLNVPRGMTRRHFASHCLGASAMVGTSLAFGRALQANAAELKRNQKSAILLWMGGGPSTIDLWDLKPGSANGGPFKPIATSGDAMICEHLPLMAKQMHHMAIVRSMSTREADHDRGRYYMHTGYVPDPNIEYPSYGAVIAHELMEQRKNLEIPPFVSVGGASEGPGFLGMAWAPFNVSSNGEIRNLKMKLEDNRFQQRIAALSIIENGFIKQNRGGTGEDHMKILKSTVDLMTSQQMEAFKVSTESNAMRDKYGRNNFGEGCLLARRLIEAGVPFVEVDLGGWDNHQNIHRTLETDKLPVLDKAMAALISDLEERGRLADTVIIWMGEFGRTPRINGDAGRDHFARAWSCVVGGGGIRGGIAVGETSSDGMEVTSTPYISENLMASVCQALEISLDTTFSTLSGRPKKIAGGGAPIKELFA